ncbi:MAG: hypothetical protein OHK0023_19000 [Anaerolineae bacterium]
MNGPIVRRCVWIASLALLMTIISAKSISAQATPQVGTVCVLAYEDVNRNNTRDPGEAALGDVSFSLMLNSNVVVANHVAVRGELFCFQNLPAQQYTLGFESMAYIPINPAPLTFALAGGQRVTYEFGATVRPPDGFMPAAESIIYVPMTPSVRVALSLGGALLVMAIFSGIGMAIYGALLYRRPNYTVSNTSTQYAISRRAAKAARRSVKVDLGDKRSRRKAEVREFDTIPAPRSEKYNDLDAE